ncbi:uncharacterized protein LOC111625589 [Centruroides sculpturatus]|uniref:uncharacterized protein LOC111625589 n=1 Tax=Centruroides sculpturatus TaxID=218467 RepID=UPI000C6D2C05|nr:uncharacterized protein LOC111625589 [Centruroides sculpturatus]XP_023224540.1 uncharacterized protein LOC111625589 [Centruroides sculpturatus]XP_023224541.1 uncharacterized protein LOC111625589 [Centruroides sculpturatus]
MVSKDRYRFRGIIMEIIDMSLDVHLRLQRCFWDPLKYRLNSVTELMGAILNLALRIIRYCNSREQFYAIKLKLILKHYVDVRFRGVDGISLKSFSEMLDEIESKLKKLVSQYKREEWISNYNWLLLHADDPLE